MVLSSFLEKMQIQYVLLLIIVGYFGFHFFEYLYIKFKHKPFFVFNHLYNRKLKENQLNILKEQFDFYKKISPKNKERFEHRVAVIIEKLSFIGRDGIEVTDQMQVLISATTVMLTFGFRKYAIKTIDTVLVYPGEYYSNISDQYHKGEFNPKLKTIVLSWEDFLNGYEISNDNLNLGMHEMARAIHLNSTKAKDVSAVLFKNTFLQLTTYLQNNEAIRKKVLETKYFRAYAFTNHYEFLSVLIESFFETPSDFRYQFPEIYKYLKRMLNFNYSDY